MPYILKASFAVLWVAEKVVRGFKHTLTLANVALQLVMGIVRIARRSLDVAKLFLRAAAHAYRFAVKAANWIIKVGLTGLIHIREISFDAQLDVASGGHFRARIDVMFFRKFRVDLRININLRSIWSIVKQLVKRMGRGFSKLFG